MDLVTLREQFVKLSGRYDLVVDTTDWADNGADFFIQAGQDMLDRMRDTPKSNNSIFQQLSAGEWYLTFERCRSIESVWINNTTGRSQLEKKTLAWLYNEFSASIALTDRKTPLYYTPARLRSTDLTDRDALGEFFNYAQADSDDLRGILILAPPDESIVVEVQGKFYSDLLSVDADESYWSINRPSTLISAALYQLEVFNRNSEGMRDWLAAISIDMADINKDVAAEEVAEITQIKG